MECFVDIPRAQVGICLQNLIARHAVGHHPDHGCDRDTQVANARNTSHLARIEYDTAKFHRFLRLKYSTLGASGTTVTPAT